MTAKTCRAAAALLAAAFLTVAAPAGAQSPEASQAQDLANCAGAVAAQANLSVLNPQTNAAGEWSTALGAILTRMNREPGVEGMTGRIAADAARGFWAEQPAAAREAAARRCRAHSQAEPKPAG